MGSPGSPPAKGAGRARGCEGAEREQTERKEGAGRELLPGLHLCSWLKGQSSPSRDCRQTCPAASQVAQSLLRIWALASKGEPSLSAPSVLLAGQAGLMPRPRGQCQITRHPRWCSHTSCRAPAGNKWHPGREEEGTPWPWHRARSLLILGAAELEG